jgi:hypothetical protein
LERGSKTRVLKTVEIRDADYGSSDFVKRIDLISSVDSGLDKAVSGGDLLLKGRSDTSSSGLDGLVDLKKP